MLIVSFLMIYFNSLTMLQLPCTIFFALHESLLSIEFPLNEVNMIFDLALNMLVTISLLMVIVLLHRSSVYGKTGHFRPTGYSFYPSSVCVASIIDIARALKPTLNHCENCSYLIIVTTSLSWDGHRIPGIPT